MKKTEIPNYYWLARTEDDKLAVPTFWGLGPTFVIPDEKIPRLSKYYPGNYSLPLIIPIALIWLYFGVSETISVTFWIISFPMILILLPPCITFILIARYRRVGSSSCLRLTAWETCIVRSNTTPPAGHFFALLNAIVWGLAFALKFLSGDPSPFSSIHFLIFVSWTSYLVLSMIPISSNTLSKLKQIEYVNNVVAARIPEFKPF